MFVTVTATTSLGQAPGILVIVYHNAFPSLVVMSVDILLNGSINEEINTAALGTVRTAVDAAAAMFAAFMDAAVIVVATAAVMDAMKYCTRPANAATESSTAGFASAYEPSVPRLIATGSAAGGCLLQPLIFSVFAVLLRNGGSDKLLYSSKGRRSSAKR